MHENIDYRRTNGESVDIPTANKLLELLMKLSEDQVALLAYQGSFGQFMTEKYQEILSNDSEYNGIDYNFAIQIRDCFERMQNSLNATNSWFDVTSKEQDYEECEGDQLLNWKDRGFKTILDILMKKYPDSSQEIPIENKMLFNKFVTKIKWNDGNESIVYCDDGTNYKADHVIVTVSLGVLKER